MESQFFDILNFDKEAALHRFNRLRAVAKFRQILELLLVLGLISWSTPRVPAVSRAAAGYLVEFSNYLFNHHVVFLIGNAIIVLLVVLCRRNDDASLSVAGADFYDDYVKHSEAAAAAAEAHQREPAPPPACDPPPPVCSSVAVGDDEKQIVVRAEETIAIPQCDDVAAAIDMATRQIKRFQRTQSEKLKREIAVKAQPELRRSETQSRRKSVSFCEPEYIESLSSEEFRRTVDAFIDKHWSGKNTKQHQFEEREKYQLMKMAY